MSEPGSKPLEISKPVVAAAFEKVRSKKGAAGVDGVTVEQFAQDYKNNLYKLWNRMSSGELFSRPGADGGDSQGWGSWHEGPRSADGGFILPLLQPRVGMLSIGVELYWSGPVLAGLLV